MNRIHQLFRIQYVSDLHLEFYDKIPAFSTFVKPVAPYLALAGDIGKPGQLNYKHFFDYVSAHWEEVFYVAGNHEYYHTHRNAWNSKKPVTFMERHKEIQDFVKMYSNVHFLNHDNPSFLLPRENMAIVGSTLWTHIPEDMHMEALRGMNDYNYIAYKYCDEAILPISPGILTEIHAKEKHMLETQIMYWNTQNVDVTVITHHMPSFSLISSKYESNPLNVCFASNCETFMLPNVKAWIYGHTHNVSSGMFGNTFVSCNSRGYPHEKITGFDVTRTFEYKRNNDEKEGLNPELAASAYGIQSPHTTTINDVKFTDIPEEDDDIVWT